VGMPRQALWFDNGAVYGHRNTRIIAKLSATRNLSSSTQDWPFRPWS
jgi:hypothetical protein